MAKKDLELEQVPPGPPPLPNDPLLPVPADREDEQPGDPAPTPGAPPDTQQPIEPEGKCEYGVAA